MWRCILRVVKGAKDLNRSLRKHLECVHPTHVEAKDSTTINLEFRSFYVCKIQAWHQIGIDLVGPLPETPLGNKYICTVTDYYTKWVGDNRYF